MLVLVGVVGVVALLSAPFAAPAVRYLAAFGSAGAGQGQFHEPCCVAVDPTSGDVYVTDVENQRVEKFDSSGRYLSQFHVMSSLGVAVDPSTQDVYVANQREVSKYDSSGKFLAAWGWGVSDGANRFEICTSSCQGGTPGSGPGQFERPQRVAVDPSNGNVLVTDSVLGRVEEFDSSGMFLSQFGTGRLKDPFGIAVAATGDVYVGNQGNMVRFSSTGSFLAQFGVASGGTGGQFPGVAINPLNGDVYATDHQGERVVEYSPSGRFLETWGWGVADGKRRLETCVKACLLGISGTGRGELFGPDGIAVAPSGEIYAVDAGNNRIVRFANPVPNNTGLPAISGTHKAHKTLRCSRGRWKNGPLTFSYQWQQNGVAIAGATRSSYRVQVTNEGRTLTCRVIASNFGGPSKPTTSKGVRISIPRRH